MNAVSSDNSCNLHNLKESSISDFVKEDAISAIKEFAFFYKESMIAFNNAIKSIPKEKFIEMERMINHKYN